ncbi:hypothetical protein JW933_08760 [candidate division FCPU426 bacterium]|nr:hypothetical protein [candidate division FCPU426 bacterium]
MFKKQLVMLMLTMLCLLVFAFSSTATIQIPKRMNYQGYLTDSSGTPINGTRNLRFRLYDAGGTLLNWVETHNSVTITNGIFNVVLGAASAPQAILVNETFREAYYLQIEVYHPPSGPWEAMSPRHLLTNAAYAMAARKVVCQQVLTVAHDGGDTNTVSGAIDMLMGAGAFNGKALSPAPSISNQWVIEVQAGRYQEPGTIYPTYTGAVTIPNWVTVRGQGWDATELYMQSRTIILSTGSALESLFISSDAAPIISAASVSYPYVRECKIEDAADTSSPAIDISGATRADIVDTSIIFYGVFSSRTGILAGGSNNCRVENCVVDFRQANPSGSACITDGGTAATDLFVLENTCMYQSSGAAGSSIGIGVRPGSTGRVSFNVTYNGNATYDFWNTVGNIPIVIGYGGPNGICNQNSTGAQVAAF